MISNLRTDRMTLAAEKNFLFGGPDGLWERSRRERRGFGRSNPRDP